MKPPGIGALFPKNAHSEFLRITGVRYDSMRDRIRKKKLGTELPFTKEEFRADLLCVMGDKEDGAIECRYCRRHFTLDEVAVDHATPISRGGSLGLDNLDYPCKADNDRKGGLAVPEYKTLLSFLNNIHPLARQDVLSRLEKANKLAAGARRNIMLLKKQQQGKKKDDELGEF